MSFTPSTSSALPASRILSRVDTPSLECSTNVTCPAVFRLEDGNFAVIGTHRTEELRDQLPPGSGVADYERLVIVPQEVMLAATKTLLWTLVVLLLMRAAPARWTSRFRSGRRQPSVG